MESAKEVHAFDTMIAVEQVRVVRTHSAPCIESLVNRHAKHAAATSVSATAMQTREQRRHSRRAIGDDAIMNATVAHIHRNLLLSAYPVATHHDLAAKLELVHLEQGELLYDCGQRITHAYFPISAVVSLMLLMENGATMEIASVGAEGIVGLPLAMGGDAMPSRAEVRAAGFAYRIKASDLKQEFGESPVMRDAILLYAQALMTLISQSSACNRHHSVSQQLCRWLLLALDRTQSNDIAITQQAIANMLGVRREGVTEATGKLEQAGINSHVRGRITVLDRARLEATCCECYGTVKNEFAQLRRRAAELKANEQRRHAASASSIASTGASINATINATVNAAAGTPPSTASGATMRSSRSSAYVSDTDGEGSRWFSYHASQRS